METPLTTDLIAKRLIDQAVAQLELLASRYFPGFALPGYLNGQPVNTMDGADLAYDLAWLYKLGVREVGGTPIIDAVLLALSKIDGPRTEIFYSYRVAETLLAFGPAFEGNPLLAGMSDAQRENLRVATDTTAMYDRAAGTIPGYPNNYWSVLARCEKRRQDLGILEDATILNVALENARALLFANPAGFFDDSPEKGGRFDIYTADTHLFCEPLWPTFDPTRLRANLQTHVALLETAVQENGAAFCWGRSVGALSVCLTMELGAAALRLGLAADPARMLGLVEHARQRFAADWVDPEDGLITSHRDRNTETYRGAYRQLQVTLDCIGKLLYAASQLKAAPALAAGTPELFPPVDAWFPFVPADAARPAGVWAFRNGQLSFGLALTYGRNSDYTPSPRSPGLFENPVDSPLICALPRVRHAGQDYAAGGRPELVEKLPAGLRVVHGDFFCSSDITSNDLLPARREAVYRVEGDALEVEENWSFDQTPEALTWHLPVAAGRPLQLEWTLLPQGALTSTVTISGMNNWRSAWGEAERLHQVNFTPAREVRFGYRVRPVVRVALTTAEHDYIRLLYEAMPAGSCKIVPSSSRELPTSPERITEYLKGCDVLHLHWPEWSFNLLSDWSEAETDRRLAAALDAIAASPTRVVWTMHNRRPHVVMAPERGRAFYRKMASIADGVIHHSQWGMELIRAELPFKPTAHHVVAGHGHFGAVNPSPGARAELEKRLGLEPCEVRYGVIGRPQKEKQVDLIVRAFCAGAPQGHQLFISASTPEIAAAAQGDPRVIIRPRGDWLTREEIATQLHACDAIVSAHTGDTYLTSGTSADAVGLGLAMLVPEWGFFRETLGDAAFYHDNTEAGLAALFGRLTASDIARGREKMTSLRPGTEWTVPAAVTIDLLRNLPRKPIL